MNLKIMWHYNNFWSPFFLQHGSSGVMSYGFIIVVLMFAYTQLGYLVFGSTIVSFKSILKSGITVIYIRYKRINSENTLESWKDKIPLFNRKTIAEP